MCTECGRGIDAPLPIDHETFERFLAQVSWYVAVLTPPGEVPIVLSAVCGVLRAAEERRQQLLQGGR
jgi:hypothetical protein